MLTSATLSVALVGVISGLFGMNLHNTYEDSYNTFVLVRPRCCQRQTGALLHAADAAMLDRHHMMFVGANVLCCGKRAARVVKSALRAYASAEDICMAPDFSREARKSSYRLAAGCLNPAVSERVSAGHRCPACRPRAR